MDQPAPLLDTGHGELPADVLASTPVPAQVHADQAHELVGPVNAVLALHAPIVEYADSTGAWKSRNVCDHCGDHITDPDAKRPDDNHFTDGWYSNLLCRKNPTLTCSHCSDGRGGRADWPCATVKALTATA